MKENKGKEVADEAIRQEVSQPCLMAGDKRKNLSLGFDLRNLPSRRKEKKPKHRSSKPKNVESTPLVSISKLVDIQILDDPEPKDSPVHISSATKARSSSLPSQQVPQNLIGNEDLAWERFGTVVIDADMVVCYNMSLKDFKHSGVHDLFKVCKLFLFFFFLVYISRLVSKVDKYLCSNKTDSQAMSKFIAASKKATDLDKTRILLEKRVKEVKDKSKRWAEVAAKAKEETKEL